MEEHFANVNEFHGLDERDIIDIMLSNSEFKMHTNSVVSYEDIMEKFRYLDNHLVDNFDEYYFDEANEYNMTEGVVFIGNCLSFTNKYDEFECSLNVEYFLNITYNLNDITTTIELTKYEY